MKMLVKFKILVVLATFLSISYCSEAQKMFNDQILCGDSKLSVRMITGNVYLGWINPDGAKELSNDYALEFEVLGTANQKFRAQGTFDWRDRTVFIMGSRWFYDDRNTATWTMLDGGNSFNKADFRIKTNTKKAHFKLVPGTLFASPSSLEGFYTFEVQLEVQDLSI